MPRPDPRGPFPVSYRLLSLALGGLVALSWSDTPGWVLGVCGVVALLGLLRVPRRLRLVELALAFLVLAAWSEHVLPAAPAALCALACLLAPEVGLARLNGIDRFMLVQEYAGHTVNSHHGIVTDRPLERDALTRAVDSLAEEVPLLRSFVREGSLSAERFYTRRPFVPAAELIQWSDDAQADAKELHQPFDLARRPAWRLLVHPTPGGDWQTVISVHHSLCDGTGQIILFDALMKRYQAFLSGTAAEPAPLLTQHPLPTFRQLLLSKGLKWNWAMMRRHVDPNAKVGVINASLLEDDAAEPDPAPRSQQTTLDRAEVERAWAAAKAYRATPNHLYLAAALRAADGWRSSRGKPDLLFRCLTPANMRPLFGLEPSLGNYTGIINLDASPELIRGETKPLLASIRDQLRKARDLDEVIEAPMNLGVSSAFLPLPTFRQALKDFDASCDSFFFSFGYTAVVFPPELTVPRDVELRRMWMMGSPARHPGVGLGPVRDGDQVHLIAGYRTPLLTDAGCEDFLARFRAELERLITEAPERKRRRGKQQGSDPS